MAPSLLSGVDPWSPDLTEAQRLELLSLVKARTDYLNQGRGREAHAVGKAILIAWHFISGKHLCDLDIPPTDFGELGPPI